jgi:hypothetical protein
METRTVTPVELSLLLHWIIKDLEWMTRLLPVTEHMEMETSLLYLSPVLKERKDGKNRKDRKDNKDRKEDKDCKYTNNLTSKLFQHLLNRNLGTRGRHRFATITETKPEDGKLSKLASTTIWDRFYTEVEERDVAKREKTTLRYRTIEGSTEGSCKTFIERKNYMIPGHKHAFSVNLRHERPVGRSLPPGYKLTSVRKKHQVTAWWNKLPFRTDFVKVWQGATEQEVNAQGPEHARHEIETEFVSSMEDLRKCWLRPEDLKQWNSEKLMGELLVQTCHLLPLPPPLSFHTMPPELRSSK